MKNFYIRNTSFFDLQMIPQQGPSQQPYRLIPQQPIQAPPQPQRRVRHFNVPRSQLVQLPVNQPEISQLFQGLRLTEAPSSQVPATTVILPVQSTQGSSMTTHPSTTLYHQRPTEQRAAERAGERVSHILRTLPLGVRISSVVDIGAGNAEITDVIAKQLSATQVYATDVYPASEFIKPSPGSIVQYIQINDEKLPFLDNSVDLVTAFVVIHHIRNFPAMLKEIYRVLKPGGFFFIREHDVTNPELVKYLDDVHRQFEPNPHEHSVAKTYYWSRENLDDLLIRFRFQKVADFNYSKYNPQAIYHSMYKKSEI